MEIHHRFNLPELFFKIIKAVQMRCACFCPYVLRTDWIKLINISRYCDRICDYMLKIKYLFSEQPLLKRIYQDIQFYYYTYLYWRNYIFISFEEKEIFECHYIKKKIENTLLRLIKWVHKLNNSLQIFPRKTAYSHSHHEHRIYPAPIKHVRLFPNIRPTKILSRNHHHIETVLRIGPRLNKEKNKGGKPTKESPLLLAPVVDGQ